MFNMSIGLHTCFVIVYCIVEGSATMCDKYLEGPVNSTLEKQLTEPDIAVLQASKTCLFGVETCVCG